MSVLSRVTVYKYIYLFEDIEQQKILILNMINLFFIIIGLYYNK